MLTFLWKHREKPPLFTRPWLKNWAKRALTFPALITGSLRIQRLRAKGARIGAGTVIGRAKIRGAQRLSVGENSFIGRAEILAYGEVKIGSNVCVNDKVLFLNGGHNVRDPAWSRTTAPIIVEDFAWVATGATILGGVKIGRGAVVSACAVVGGNIPDFAVAFGNPAQIIENARTKSFHYSPVRLVALFNAWLGSASRGIEDP
jgi:acetyltransferase-like isoleucine patch superfamily enzyme